MSDIVIRVENLSKRYRIGSSQGHFRYGSLRDSIAKVVKAPFSRFKSSSDSAINGPGYIWALKDVSFEVKQGEVIGIIGRNGAGKSTLLKILTRITKPTEGQVGLRGRVGSLLEVGTGFHPELTGRENIYLNGAVLGMKRNEIDAKFDEIVDFADTEKFLDTPVKHYSSGMYMRLAFAIAAHLEPEILLVDEVLAVGDAEFQKKCMGKMGEVAREGRTVLFVSHNLIALRSLCPTALWLDHGKLLEEGPSSKIVDDYLQLQSKNIYDQKWDDPSIAPGNDIVRLHRVWVKLEDHSILAGIPHASPISIGVEYWHIDPKIQLHVTLYVYVEQQVVAFTTASTHDPAWQEFAQRTGLMRATCQIPENFLNTGQHRINVLIIGNLSNFVFSLEDALSFDVIETAPRAGAWFGKDPGVLRPKLPWINEYLGNGVNQVTERQI